MSLPVSPKNQIIQVNISLQQTPNLSNNSVEGEVCTINVFQDIQKIQQINIVCAPDVPLTQGTGGDQQVSDQKQMCEICLVEQPSSQMLKSTSTCNCTYCRQCLSSYLLAMMQQGKFIGYKCANEQCAEQLTESDICRHLDNETLFNKYKLYRKQSIVAQDPDVRWCTTADCETALRRVLKSSSTDEKSLEGGCEGGTTPTQDVLECHKCHARTCFACGQKEHVGKSCQEAQDPTLKQFCNAQEIRRCPRCLQLIQRTMGCQHMTCTVCHLKFCYLCEQPCTEHHVCFGWASSLQVANGNFCQQLCYWLVYAIEKILTLIYQLIVVCVVVSVAVIVYHLAGPGMLGLKVLDGKFHTFMSKKTNSCFATLSMVFLIVIFYPLLFVLIIFPGYFYLLYKAFHYVTVEVPKKQIQEQKNRQTSMANEFQIQKKNENTNNKQEKVLKVDRKDTIRIEIIPSGVKDQQVGNALNRNQQQEQAQETKQVEVVQVQRDIEAQL